MFENETSKTVSPFQKCNLVIVTEGIMMKSIGVTGVTLNGVDPIQQQLDELDAQSRLLTGIEKFEKQKRNPRRISNISSTPSIKSNSNKESTAVMV